MALESADEARQFLEVRPYVTTRQTSHFPEFGEDESSTEFDGGIDLLWKFGGGRKLVATINPDFSEIEPDTIQLDINRRFAAFYAENRPFFTENASQFGSLIPLVYTRSITDPAVAAAYVEQGQEAAGGRDRRIGSRDQYHRCGPGRLQAHQHGHRVAQPARPRAASSATRAGGSAC